MSAPAVDVLELVRATLAGAGGDASSATDRAPDGPAGLLAALLDQRRAQLEATLDADAEEDRVAEALAATRELATDLAAEVADLRAEMDRLGSRCDRLAAALGACAACWGEDPACRWCRGRGRVGALAPDREEFAVWVLPAVRTHVRLHGARTPDAGGGPVVAEQEENA